MKTINPKIKKDPLPMIQLGVGFFLNQMIKNSVEQESDRIIIFLQNLLVGN